MRKVIANHEAPSFIARRLPFKGSNLYGETHTPGTYFYSGYLPAEYAETLRDADYIVSSYSTPIAWHLSDGWVIPPATYSVTTARHQGYARQGARGERSAHHIPAHWELGLTETQGRALRNLRRNGHVSTADYARRTLQALVDRDLAAWSADGKSLTTA